MGLGHTVPYQMRHSGPSIDRCLSLRTIEECQKRGRWKTWKSLTRYEKAARLGAAWSALAPAEQARLTQCETNVAALVLGSPQRPRVELPP